MAPNLIALYETLQKRCRPEDVAELLLPLLENQLTQAERDLLNTAAANSLRRMAWQYSSMADDFNRPTGPAQQAAKAAELFAYPLPKPARDAAYFDEPVHVKQLLATLSPQLGKAVGHNDYRTDRLDRAGRTAAGLGHLSRRRYNKQFRVLRHLEKKLRSLLSNYQLRETQMISKHGFAHEITTEEFARDLHSAVFIAYYTARCNRRSVFTNQSQDPPYDTISEMLFRRCLLAKLPAAPTTNWWAIAHVYPAPAVLTQLPAEQQGQLLGRWMTLLNRLADDLRRVWEANTFRRDSMIVKRGDDSSTWNLTAGAWNKARDNWVNLLYALGMEFVLEEVCPGKVLRLMAADVAHWHRATGGGLDPNTQVWAELPLPWQVLGSQASCTREQVAAACGRARLDSEKSGWLAPRPHGVVTFRPTPELVHGVAIENPYLALILRRNRVFSGKLPTRQPGQ